jgi:hypothetical protein
VNFVQGDRVLVSVFIMCTVSFPNIFCFSNVCLCLLCQILDDCSCVVLFLGFSYSFSVGLLVCFCATIILFFVSFVWVCLSWIHIINWSLVLWWFQCCSFLLMISLIFRVFYVSIWNWGLIFLTLWWMSLGFWLTLHWICRLLLVV